MVSLLSDLVWDSLQAIQFLTNGRANERGSLPDFDFGFRFPGVTYNSQPLYFLIHAFEYFRMSRGVVFISLLSRLSSVR